LAAGLGWQSPVGGMDSSRGSGDYTVARVLDGDTIRLTDDRRVRLAQIDTPELIEHECYADNAKRELASLVPVDSRISLKRDSALDDVEQYGRLIRYVVTDQTNVNLALVRRGAASVWFVDGDRGRYAKPLLRGARNARRSDRGLWRACPGTRLDTSHGVQTSATPGTQRPPLHHNPSHRRSGCDPSYPTVCIPPAPPDLDCADITYSGFAVRRPDPHGFDGEADGVGCEG
jgi:micrococcal nuclease